MKWLQGGGLFIALLTLGVQLWSPVEPAAASVLTPMKCRDRIVVDYQQAMTAIRPRANPPPSGRLPFGPAGLELINLGPTLVAGGGTIGFSLINQVQSRSEGHLEWVAQSTLTVIRRNGKPIRVAQTRQQNVEAVIRGRSEELRLGNFRVPRRPEFYRLDLVFRRGGVTEQRYSEYFRVVPRRVDLRLALSSTTPSPGDRLTWRLENYGTVPFSYGMNYRIERYEEGRWVTDPITPPWFPANGFSSGAGTASRCQSAILPQESRFGLYRVSKSASSGVSRERSITAEFTLTG